MLDWTITFGNIVQIVTLVGAAFTMFLGLGFRIKGVEKELEKLSTVIVTLAVQRTEIDFLRQRIDDLERNGVPETYPQILRRHQV